MKWINYHHLQYFWMVARHGSIVRASEELLVSQPTISNQLKELEAALGHRLFDRAGRGLRLTEMGHVTFNYANQIFTLGQELLAALDQRATPALRLAVGVLDMIPKPVARELLAPALALDQPVRLVCREDKADRLLADLAARRTDVVISDAPLGTSVQLAGHNHLLGEWGVSFFATPELAARYRRGFPKSLDGAPLLLPADHTQLRRSLNHWFDARRIHPVVAGEFDDSALMFSFGHAGAGAFPAASILEPEVHRRMDMNLIGRIPDIRERFYAITLDATPSHPAVRAICDGPAAGARRRGKSQSSAGAGEGSASRPRKK